jgi:photosystem I subunit III
VISYVYSPGRRSLLGTIPEYDGIQKSQNPYKKSTLFVKNFHNFVIEDNCSMRRLFALIIVCFLWVGITAPASADVAGLVPCKDSPAFQKRATMARNTTADPTSGKQRFERYSQALCGPEGLPHLIVDGRLSRAGDFLIPSALFLYIAGWIGWVGRAYIIAARKSDSPTTKEIIIDVPLAIRCIFQGPLWPLLAVKELTTGELTAKDSEITVSPR